MVASRVASVEDVDDHAPVDPHRGRLGDRPDRIRDPSPFADHAAEVLVGDGDLVDEVAVLFELLDHDRLGVLDEGLDEKLQQLRHRRMRVGCVTGCAWAPDWPSRSRTQGAAFASGKGKAEDEEMRSARRVIQVCPVTGPTLY